MVTEGTMAREQLREIDRQQRIDLALAAGNQKLAEWIRTEMGVRRRLYARGGRRRRAHLR